MEWKRARAEYYKAVYKFAVENEWEKVNLTERISKNGPNDNGITNIRNHLFYVHFNGANDIANLLLVSRYGLIIPYFTDTDTLTGKQKNEISSIIKRNMRTPHTLMGLGKHVELTSEIIGKHPTHINRYHLMVLFPGKDFTIESPPVQELKLRFLEPDEEEHVFPLQRGYELEEVLVYPNEFNPASCRKNLSHLLKTQQNVVAEINGMPIAKGGTNAQGFTCNQIGGIYTKPEYRGCGVARYLMKFFLKELLAQEKAVCLFVKKENNPAVKLYTSLGFKTKNDFSIVYYH